jgi:hypothetical protein
MEVVNLLCGYRISDIPPLLILFNYLFIFSHCRGSGTSYHSLIIIKEAIMPKQYKTNNEQTMVFRIVNANNKTVGFVNILDDLDPTDYQVMENHLLHLLETKQVTIDARPFNSGEDTDIASGFKLPKTS